MRTSGSDPRIVRRSLWIWLGLVGLGWFYLIPRYLSAQEKKPEGAPPSAPAAVPAPQTPAVARPDPAGTKTGDAGLALDASSTPVFPSKPTKPERQQYPNERSYEEAQKRYDEELRGYEEYLEQSRKEPLVLKLANAVGHNRAAINMTWILFTGILVMFMQAGFSLIATGLCRAKNAAHTMSMNFLIYPLSMLGFYVCGFAFMFGGASNVPTLNSPAVLDGVWTIGGWNLLGMKGFFLSKGCYDVSVFAIFFFQMVFMDIAATIPTGACAERWKYSAFVLYGIAVGAVMYPVYAGWVWGQGWCSQLGIRAGMGHGTCDFAGSSVVHLQGGIIAFWFAKLLGPRVGKFNKDGSPNPIPAHSIPMVMLGTLILAFGWFGFNPGGSWAGTDLRNAMSVVNTMLASATGAVGATLWMWKIRGDKPDPSIMCNGLLAGLVSISASCAFVSSASACLIGLVAGVLVVESVFFVERKLKIDDPVGAISVHGVNGLWGTLAVGLLADGTYGDGYNGVFGTGVTGLFYGDAKQLLAQALGAGACLVYQSVASIAIFKGISALTGGARPPMEVEVEGLDIPEMGCLGYSGVVMDKASESPVSR